MFKEEIRLDEGDKHFIGLYNKDYITEKNDWYILDRPKDGLPRPYIIIHLPEVKNLIYPTLSIRYKASSWYSVCVYKGKSKDTKNWVKIFEDTSMGCPDTTNNILLDRNYEYYKIEWADGRYPSEKTWLFKVVTLKGYTPEEMIVNVMKIDPLLVLAICLSSLGAGVMVGLLIRGW